TVLSSAEQVVCLIRSLKESSPTRNQNLVAWYTQTFQTLEGSANAVSVTPSHALVKSIGDYQETTLRCQSVEDSLNIIDERKTVKVYHRVGQQLRRCHEAVFNRLAAQRRL